MNGCIYGIGVGVGDPEDMTLKAIKRIKESDLLICPKEDLNECRAYQIVKQVIPEVEDIDTLPIEFEMTKDENKRAQNTPEDL
ncbi:Precorrin-2 methylase [Treponema sp. JC4]|uniref:SAM-dependent methyltransferase n=1 Tax=Treponema sp. JC4 TaxID=1124982 RepID=UPI00025B0CFB|nr:SAM-dependent methyltransferase [Treponema sp. JC4]EID83889.1 Precorrin-2 methylase [Treponema sp. JC4]